MTHADWDNARRASRLCVRGVVLAATLVVALSLSASTTARGGWLITAYGPGCGASGRTFTGTWPHRGTVAVDPHVIPLGALIHVDGYGWGSAEDTGSAVRGHHVDVWLPSCHAAFRFTHYGRVWWPRR